MHKQATGKHAVLPDFANGTTSCLFVTNAAVQVRGTCVLRRSIIDGSMWPSRRSSVGVDGLVLEQTGIDTCHIRIQLTADQHKTTRISEPRTGYTQQKQASTS